MNWKFLDRQSYEEIATHVYDSEVLEMEKFNLLWDQNGMPWQGFVEELCLLLPVMYLT